MIKHLKNKGGIYIIINKISHNYYIGSADINNIYRRFTNHMLNFHGSKLVKKAVLKDGLNNFIFAILEYYPNNDNNLITEPLQNRKYLYELETMYLISLMPKYNILTEAGTSIGYKHTDETIEYLKSLFTNERRLLLSKLQSERKGQ
jgi:group I intron endonuclease